MKVNIEHKEYKKGLFKKKIYNQVDVTVDFNEEEMSVIERLDLAPRDTRKGMVVLDGYYAAFLPDKPEYIIYVSTLIRGDNEYILESPSEAKRFEADLTDMLTKLKGYLDDNTGIEENSTSFEL